MTVFHPFLVYCHQMEPCSAWIYRLLLLLTNNNAIVEKGVAKTYPCATSFLKPYRDGVQQATCCDSSISGNSLGTKWYARSSSISGHYLVFVLNSHNQILTVFHPSLENCQQMEPCSAWICRLLLLLTNNAFVEIKVGASSHQKVSTINGQRNHTEKTLQQAICLRQPHFWKLSW